MALGHARLTPFRPYDFEEANQQYVQSGQHAPDLIVGARSRVGIITCCDARCIPERFFQLEENEAFVIRNAGGRTAVDDVMRSLVLVQTVSEIKEIKVVHHTGKQANINFFSEIRLT
jgi:carbonic anhydrase